MVLVGYSDSEGSDSEGPAPPPKPKSQPATTSKPAINKLVDRANPSKIVVSLPNSSSSSKSSRGNADSDEPPAKKARTGGGFGGGGAGFNAMLPAPKRTGVVGSGLSSAGGSNGDTGGAGGSGLKRGVGRGLGVGINLKTGAAPAFSRQATVEDDYDETGNRISTASVGTSTGPILSPALAAAETSEQEVGTKVQNEAQEVKLVGKPMMFRPLSVMNKKKKKPVAGTLAARAAAAAAANKTPEDTTNALQSTASLATATKPKPKVSLFSADPAEDTSISTASHTKGEYQPIIHTPSIPTQPLDTEDTQDPYPSQPSQPSIPAGQSDLTSIADSLNLTASQRRQLFGRASSSNPNAQPTAINVMNFNTDAEYAHNESLRATGEALQHNAVRAIAPGKHSLQQLVNAATNQKDALEEHFASGRRNKKEAGTKYGW